MPPPASSPPSQAPAVFPTTHLLCALRAHVTGASPDYVGSVTLSRSLCAFAALSHRQLVQIRVERTGLELWTYVIRAAQASPDEQVCVNGAAALHVKAGDVVCIAAYGRCMRAIGVRFPFCDVVDSPPRLLAAPSLPPADDVFIDMAVGKIHRPRVTKVVNAAVPCVAVDEGWMEIAGMLDGQQVHVVNVTNGQRDILVVRGAARGSRACEVHMCAMQVEMNPPGFGARSGYAVGDVIIVMAYCTVSKAGLSAEGNLPKMRTCFPYEIPEKEREKCRRILEGCES